MSNTAKFTFSRLEESPIPAMNPYPDSVLHDTARSMGLSNREFKRSIDLFVDALYTTAPSRLLTDEGTPSDSILQCHFTGEAFMIECLSSVGDALVASAISSAPNRTALRLDTVRDLGTYTAAEMGYATSDEYDSSVLWLPVTEQLKAFADAVHMETHPARRYLGSAQVAEASSLDLGSAALFWEYIRQYSMGATVDENQESIATALDKDQAATAERLGQVLAAAQQAANKAPETSLLAAAANMPGALPSVLSLPDGCADERGSALLKR
jgi:hypothetical protein